MLVGAQEEGIGNVVGEQGRRDLRSWWFDRGAVTRAFAREGARVFLAGRTKAKLDRVADDIRSNGGVVDTAVVDALDERTVEEYVGAVVEDAGHIDISFNLISYGDIQQPLTEISVEDFTRPITTAAERGRRPSPM